MQANVCLPNVQIPWFSHGLDVRQGSITVTFIGNMHTVISTATGSCCYDCSLEKEYNMKLFIGYYL